MEYRQAIVTGEYDPESEVVLSNQVWNDQIGVHVLTPLWLNDGDRSILVDRGWVPLDDFNSGQLEKYAEPGQVTVKA
jgi:surfeit locus 1 family protein